MWMVTRTERGTLLQDRKFEVLLLQGKNRHCDELAAVRLDADARLTMPTVGRHADAQPWSPTGRSFGARGPLVRRSKAGRRLGDVERRQIGFAIQRSQLTNVGHRRRNLWEQKY
jgi:hypothetical protein